MPVGAGSSTVLPVVPRLLDTFERLALGAALGLNWSLMKPLWIASLLVVGLVAGCGGGAAKPAPRPPVEPVKIEQHGLVLEVEPVDAEVEIDGTSRGSAAELQAVQLEPGAHQIIIRKAGHETWRGEVEITTRSEKIQVRLVPAP